MMTITNKIEIVMYAYYTYMESCLIIITLSALLFFIESDIDLFALCSLCPSGGKCVPAEGSTPRETGGTTAQ